MAVVNKSSQSEYLFMCVFGDKKGARVGPSTGF